MDKEKGLNVKEIAEKEVARQVDFGYEPSYEDMVISGIEAAKAHYEAEIREIFNQAEELCSGGTLHDDEGYIVINPKKWQALKSRYIEEEKCGK